MIEFAISKPWLIPLLPLVAACFIGVFGKWLKGGAAVPAILAMLGSVALSVGLLCGFSNGTIERPLQETVYEWFAAGSFKVPAAYYIDQLTALYLTFVTVIGTLIFVFAAGYMKGDYGFWRFFAYLSLFVFAMTVLVMGNNFVVLYLGWEGVGLASYLLIGYYYPRPSAVAAAKKAFITNRIGDFGLAIGIFLIYANFGTVEYTKFFGMVAHGHLTAGQIAALGWIPYCLMLGAFGKSAQFPLHVWLPDAMEGPTPVSALIHAATMVTAGVYLIARCMPVFHADALIVVACVGGFTAFMAATMALCQYDLKKIWAYSTLSQLGYMFLGLGVGATASGVFHVFTHAWFKALLFLSAGSVMHAMGGELDIRKMSGVRKVMPITCFTMLIGCLALAGVPPFAGFWSKDEILAAALNSETTAGLVFGIVGVGVALLTAYYTFRLFFRVFMGPVSLPPNAGGHEASPFALAEEQGHGQGDHAVHGHDAGHVAGHDAGHGHSHGDATKMKLDGSPLMWVPLLILCVGAAGAGLLGYFGGAGGQGGWIHHFLAPVFGGGGHGAEVAVKATAHVERISHGGMMILSGSIAVVGILLAAYFHWMNRHAADIVGANLKPLVAFLYNKWYIDEIYKVLITKSLWVLGHILSIVDRYVVDGVVFMVGFGPQLAGYTLKPTQRGLLGRYAVGMIAGLTAVVLGVLYLMK